MDTSSGFRLPDFLGLGGMRCGSTQLQAMLRTHPELYFAEPKELHFFDNLRGLYDSGMDAYAHHFSDADRRQKVGEVTPAYLYIDYAGERIKRLVPNTPLFVILREPIERLWSHYCYNVISGYERLTLRRALEAEETKRSTNYFLHGNRYSYVSYSSYAFHLKRLYQMFPAEQIHILFFEDFLKCPHETLKPLCRHLGVSDDTENLMTVRIDAVANKGRFVRSLRLQYALRNSRPATGDSLYGKALRRINRSILTVNTTSARPMRLRDRTLLAGVFREKNEELQDLIRRKLPWGH